MTTATRGVVPLICTHCGAISGSHIGAFARAHAECPKDDERP